MAATQANRQQSIGGLAFLLVATVVAVLAFSVQQTQHFAADAAAAQTLARAQRGTDKLATDLRALRPVLGEGGSIVRAVEKLEDVRDYLAEDLTALAEAKAIGGGDALIDSASLALAENAEALSVISAGWPRYSQSLDALFATEMTDADVVGRKLAFAIVASRAHGDAIADALENVTDSVNRASAQRVRQFRFWLLCAFAVAGITFILILLRQRGTVGDVGAVAARARSGTEQILKTVGEGLFLLDRQHRIGSELSDATKTMFRREKFAGLTFDALLRDIVPENTVRTAIDFVELLWGERANEKLIQSLNPLHEVEVHFATDGGAFESRHLSFAFSRVRTHGKVEQLLVTVNDVTDKVQLARELQESQTQQQAQLNLLLAILHIDATQLADFLAAADGSMNLVNTVLKLPARDEASFRDKLDKIFREVHLMKSDAAALGLRTVEQKAHAFEDALSELRNKSGLTGNDFLPLAVKLDDLFEHLASVRELVDRIGETRAALTPAPQPVDDATGSAAVSVVPNESSAENDGRTLRLPGPTPAVLEAAAEHAGLPFEPPADGKTQRLAGPTAAVLEAAAAHAAAADGKTVRLPGAAAAVIAAAAERAAAEANRSEASSATNAHASTAIEMHLRQLAENIALTQRKSVSLVCIGLENVPSDYQRPVRDVATQMVRNAVAHGIELPAARQAAGKPDEGTIVLEFIERGSDGFELVFQDDGAGIDVERVREVAIERGMMSSQAAEIIDPRKLIGLIFRAGFSTATEVDEDAGRGVGLDVVHDVVTKLGGRVGVASKPGEYTRFRVKLPANARTQAA